MLSILEAVKTLTARLVAHRDDRGVAAVEYAFLVALIAVVCLLAVTFFGTQTSQKFSTNVSSLEAAG